MDKFIEQYNKIINENLIEHIQNQLLKYFKKTTWKEYIDSLQFGQCQKIAKIVYQICPWQVEVYEVEEQFCQKAIEQLQNIGDTNPYIGNHYIVKINNIFYDFGKGANTIKGIYTIGTNQQKYTVELSKEELKYFIKFYLRDCNYWDNIKINKKSIVQFKENKKILSDKENYNFC